MTKRLAIQDPDQLVFGQAPKPVITKGGLTIGGGVVYPESNFTLPPFAIETSTMPRIRTEYRDMVRSAARRAVELGVEDLVRFEEYGV